MRQIEHKIQVSCVRWFRYQYQNKIIFAIPNGGARSVVTGAMLKAEGATKGVPDLLIPEPCGKYHGLFAEMKKPHGRTSHEQDMMIDALRDRGYYVAVCYDVEQFVNLVNNYFAERL